MKKKVASFILAIALMVSALSIPASASIFGGIQTCAALCDECNIGQVYLKSTTYSDWYIYGYQACSHGDKTRNDIIKKRTVIRIYACNYSKCGMGYTVTSEQSKIVHPT